jgi:hypothetical protein
LIARTCLVRAGLNEDECVTPLRPTPSLAIRAVAPVERAEAWIVNPAVGAENYGISQ